MTKKSFPQAEGPAQVSFELTADVQGQSICVLGTFNDWQSCHVMRRRDDGVWQCEVELQPGQYEYRFLVDGERWINDPQADGYTPNPYGEHNCIIMIEAVAMPNPQTDTEQVGVAQLGTQPRVQQLHNEG
jgi:1,4-alpha-glucan branching enzyme